MTQLATGTSLGHSEDRAQRALWRSFSRGVRYNVVAEFGIQVLRFSAMVILARALGPSDFGLFKIVLVLGLLAVTVAQFGVSDALVQRRTLSPQVQAAALWASVGLTVAVAGAMWLCAPVAARWLRIASLRWALRLMCAGLVLEGLSAVPDARLRREMRFGALAAADFVAELGFVVVALGMLAWGAGVGSLVGGLAARFALHGLVLWVACGRSALRSLRPGNARELARFSLSAACAKVVVLTAGNLDYVLVGCILGSSALGFYAMAWDLLRFVPDRMHKVAGRVALPAFCRLARTGPSLAAAYRGLFAQIARIVVPVAACLALAAPEVIEGIYGPRWLPAAMPLRLLAFGLALVGLRVGMGSVFYTRDYPSFDVYLNGARVLLIIAAVSIASRFGLGGVSAAMSLTEGVVSLVGIGLACRLARMSPLELVRCLGAPLRSTAFCLLAVAAGKWLVFRFDLYGVAAALAVSVPATGVFLALEFASLAEAVGLKTGTSQPAASTMPLDGPLAVGAEGARIAQPLVD